MRKRSMGLIVFLAALLLQSGQAYSSIDSPFEFYRQDINPAIVIDSTTLVDGKAGFSPLNIVTLKGAYDGISGIAKDGPFEERFRLNNFSGIYNFIADFTSALDLEPSTLLLIAIGILGLLTYRRKRMR